MFETLWRITLQDPFSWQANTLPMGMGKCLGDEAASVDGDGLTWACTTFCEVPSFAAHVFTLSRQLTILGLATREHLWNHRTRVCWDSRPPYGPEIAQSGWPQVEDSPPCRGLFAQAAGLAAKNPAALDGTGVAQTAMLDEEHQRVRAPDSGRA